MARGRRLANQRRRHHHSRSVTDEAVTPRSAGETQNPATRSCLTGGKQRLAKATIKRSDLVAVGQSTPTEPAKFGSPAEERSLVAAKERPDAQVVDLRLDLEPKTRTRPAGCGPCDHCGGFMARSDSDEWKCLQCGRANTPPRVLSAEELKVLRRHVHSA